MDLPYCVPMVVCDLWLCSLAASAVECIPVLYLTQCWGVVAALTQRCQRILPCLCLKTQKKSLAGA